MKILFTGGGSGGHFYPLIAVAEELRDFARKEKILPPKLYFMAPEQYDAKILFDHEIEFVSCPAGKKRVGASGVNIIKNFIDIFKMGIGITIGFFKVFVIFPDVIFAKGGYVSFPALLSARILGIPVVLHESDSVPGRVNLWASKFATRVAVSYKEAADFFPKDKVAYTGNPVRQDLQEPLTVGAHEYLGLEDNIPVIFVLGGSQGAKIINDSIIAVLPRLVEKYQIIHQTGQKNLQTVKEMAGVVLENNPHAGRFRPFDYLNSLAMRMSAGVCNLVISRGGSTIFEIAMWGKPSIIIPITVSNGDHQRKNAYNYAREGAATVIEESNLSQQIMVNEIDRIINNQKIAAHMGAAAKKFARADAAQLIAVEILKIALAHEKN